MKKLILLLVAIFFISISYSQVCITIDGDTASLNTNTFYITQIDDSLPVHQYTYGSLNKECEWDTRFILYYLENGSDTLQINDSLAYITYWDEGMIVRETWEKNPEWTKTYTMANRFTDDMLPTRLETDSVIVNFYYDNIGGLTAISEMFNDTNVNYPVRWTEYEFNSNGDITTETIRYDDNLEYLFKYDIWGSWDTEKLIHYPDADQSRWIIEDFTNSVLIQYQEFDDFFWRWDVINSMEYPTCWFYVDIPENLDVADVIDVKYFNLLGQQIEKPMRGFYIEKQISRTGSIAKKYYIQ